MDCRRYPALEQRHGRLRRRGRRDPARYAPGPHTPSPIDGSSPTTIEPSLAWAAYTIAALTAIGSLVVYSRQPDSPILVGVFTWALGAVAAELKTPIDAATCEDKTGKADGCNMLSEMYVEFSSPAHTRASVHTHKRTHTHSLTHTHHHYYHRPLSGTTRASRMVCRARARH